MIGRLNLGETLLALVLIAIGGLWIAVASGMPMWEGFAPQSGFLPLIYGVLLFLLCAALLLQSLFLQSTRDAETADAPTIGKPLLVLAALTVGVAGIDFIGFAASMFIMLGFLFAVVERRPLIAAIPVAALNAAMLVIVFRSWLGVPLPRGPWGF